MDMAEKLSITLPTDMVSAIKQRVASGSYGVYSEVLREAMRTWMRQEEEREERMAALRAKVQQSLSDPRPAIPSGEAFNQIRAELKRKLLAE